MKSTITKISSLTAGALLTIGLLTTSNAAEANCCTKPKPTYSPCPAVKDQLMAKVYRLKRLAKEREYTGDAYGARKLRNTANIILAHVGDLPCVNHHICPL